MGLEENVQKFAEEARNILLLAIQESKIARPGKAYWLGYTSGGNGLVRQDQKIKAVKVVGNASLPTNSIVYIDETNTVDIGFTKDRVAAKKTKPEIAAQKALIRRKRPLIDEIVKKILTGWILMYNSRRLFDRAGSFFTSSIYINDIYNKVPSDSYTQACSPNWETSTGKTYRISVVAAYCYTLSLTTQSSTTATANASCGGASVSTSATSLGPLVYDFDGDYEVIQSSSDTDAVTSGTQDLNRVGNIGDSIASAKCQYLVFPNAEVYYQLPNDENDQPVRRKVDLKSLVTHDILGYNHVQNFSIKEGSDLYVYSIFTIFEVDMSVNDQISFTQDQYEKIERRGIGRVYETCLHVRLNMQTGGIESRKTTSGPSSGYYYEIGYTASSNSNTASTFISEQAYSISPFGYGNNGYGGELTDPSPIWSNAYSGNWVSAFSGIPYDASAAANLSASEINRFLNQAWVANKWRSGFHSAAPYVNLAGGVISSLSFTYNWDPVANPTSNNRWQGGLPYYNDYYDIENLPVVVETVANRAAEYPNADEFVRYTQSGNLYTERGGPNYVLALSYDSPVLNGDQLDIMHMRVSYNVPADQVGGSTDPYNPQP